MFPRHVPQIKLGRPTCARLSRVGAFARVSSTFSPSFTYTRFNARNAARGRPRLGWIRYSLFGDPCAHLPGDSLISRSLPEPRVVAERGFPRPFASASRNRSEGTPVRGRQGEGKGEANGMLYSHIAFPFRESNDCDAKRPRHRVSACVRARSRPNLGKRETSRVSRDTIRSRADVIQITRLCGFRAALPQSPPGAPRRLSRLV